MTRQEALGKTAYFLGEAESALGDVNVGKYLSLAQLYLSFAHELNEPDILLPEEEDPQWEKDLLA
jgi:hypothetical protein